MRSISPSHSLSPTLSIFSWTRQSPLCCVKKTKGSTVIEAVVSFQTIAQNLALPEPFAGTEAGKGGGEVKRGEESLRGQKSHLFFRLMAFQDCCMILRFFFSRHETKLLNDICVPIKKVRWNELRLEPEGPGSIKSLQ